MSNLIDLQSQIEKLQKQAADIKAREFDKTVQEIQAKMAAFGITIKDLQGTKGRAARSGRGKAKVARAATPGPRKGATKAPVKFRGPEGQTWSGRGQMAGWLAKLIEQGRSKDEFAV